MLCWLPPGGPFIPHGIISSEGFVNCSASSSPPPHGAGGPHPATCYRIQTSRLGLETDLFILGLGGCFPQIKFSQIWIPNTKFPEFCDLEKLLFAFLYPRECPTGERSGGPNHHDHLRCPVDAAPTHWGHRGCKAGVPKCHLAIPWWRVAREALGTVGQSTQFPSSVGFGGEMVLVMEQRDVRAAVFGKPNMEQLGGTGVHWSEASWSCWGLPWGWLGPGRSAGPWGCSAPPNLGGDGEKGARASQGLTPLCLSFPSYGGQGSGLGPTSSCSCSSSTFSLQKPSGAPSRARRAGFQPYPPLQ